MQNETYHGVREAEAEARGRLEARKEMAAKIHKCDYCYLILDAPEGNVVCIRTFWSKKFDPSKPDTDDPKVYQNVSGFELHVKFCPNCGREALP